MLGVPYFFTPEPRRVSRALRGSGFQRNQLAASSRVATNSLKVRPFVTFRPFGLSLPLLTGICRIKVCVVVLLATGEPDEIARARIPHWVGHTRLYDALAIRSVPVQTIHVTPCVVVVTHASIIPAPPTYLNTNRRSVFARKPRCGAHLPRSPRGFLCAGLCSLPPSLRSVALLLLRSRLSRQPQALPSEVGWSVPCVLVMLTLCSFCFQVTWAGVAPAPTVLGVGTGWLNLVEDLSPCRQILAHCFGMALLFCCCHVDIVSSPPTYLKSERQRAPMLRAPHGAHSQRPHEGLAPIRPSQLLGQGFEFCFYLASSITAPRGRIGQEIDYDSFR